MIAVAGEAGTSKSVEGEFSRRSSRLWPDFAAELQVAAGHELSYVRNGALIVRLAEDTKDWPRAGDDSVHVVDASRARAIEPMLTGEYAEILWAPDEAQVDNRALGPALAEALSRAGGKLVRGDAVSAVVRVRDRAVGVVGVRTRYHADAVVIAAGAWSSKLDGLPQELRETVKPIKGEMIALSHSGAPLRLRRVVRGHAAYLVPRDERVFVGATEEDAGYNASLTRRAVGRLTEAAARLAPNLADWTVVEHWAGFRPRTPDGLPILGPTSVEGLFAATGQYRNGILFAPGIAELICRAVLERASVPAEFDPRRFASGID
jgi:glycine oxidase